MPIAVTCSDCGKLYRLKDSVAGKSFACKECGTKIQVPRPRPKKKESANPWDDVDEREDADEWEAEDDDSRQSERSAPRKRKSPSRGKSNNNNKSKKKSSMLSLLLIGGGLFAFLLCAGFAVLMFGVASSLKPRGGNIASSNDANNGDFEQNEFGTFQRITFAGGKASAMMPNTAKAKNSQNVNLGKSTKHSTFNQGLNFLTNKYYACEIIKTVIPAEITPELRPEFDKNAFKIVDDQFRSGKFKLLDDRTITLGTVKGHEYRYQSNKFIITLQTYIGKDVSLDANFYEWEDSPKPKLKKQFFDSIEIEGNKR